MSNNVIPFVARVYCEKETPRVSFEDISKVIHEEIDEQVWECVCGCQLFYIKPFGMECGNCGTYANFDD